MRGALVALTVTRAGGIAREVAVEAEGRVMAVEQGAGAVVEAMRKTKSGPQRDSVFLSER